MVSLSLALIEGVRVNTLQLETECIADIGMDSMMAEYHRELFRRYNILALDTSYGTGTVGRVNAQNRLKFYLEKNLQKKGEDQLGGLVGLIYKDFLKPGLESAQITETAILSDGAGIVFRNEVLNAIRNDLGFGIYEDLTGWMQTIDAYQLDTRDIEAEKRAVDEQISSYEGRRIQINEEEWETVWFDDPTEVVENRKLSGIIQQVFGDEAQISEKSLNEENLISRRMQQGRVNQGNIAPGTANENLIERYLFTEYLMRCMGCYLDVKEGCALNYEVEYLIAGQRTDEKNLTSVLHRILAMREAANAVYLFSDPAKSGEADAIAYGISLVIASPEAQGAIKTALILAWAYAESVYDLKVVMKGGRVPLLKDAGSWHYGLSNILADLWEEPGQETASGGMSYQDYLRILILLSQTDQITQRTMNLVEANVRLTPGNENFRLDACYVRIAAVITLKSAFGYRQVIPIYKTYGE